MIASSRDSAILSFKKKNSHGSDPRQGEKTAKLARDLHGTVIRKNNEISFNVQQDAQEFLLWLLHQFHEDLRDAGRRGRNVARNSFRKIKSLRKNYAFSPLPQRPVMSIEIDI